MTSGVFCLPILDSPQLVFGFGNAVFGNVQFSELRGVCKRCRYEMLLFDFDDSFDLDGFRRQAQAFIAHLIACLNN